MRYFGFAVSDSMFPSTCTVSRKALTPEQVKDMLAGGGVAMCLNPSHKATCDAAVSRFGLNITIPPSAANVNLKSGDSVIVMSARGLPRMEGRHEYTVEEIAAATFVFGLWTVA